MSYSQFSVTHCVLSLVLFTREDLWNGLANFCVFCYTRYTNLVRKVDNNGFWAINRNVSLLILLINLIFPVLLTILTEWKGTNIFYSFADWFEEIFRNVGTGTLQSTIWLQNWDVEKFFLQPLWVSACYVAGVPARARARTHLLHTRLITEKRNPFSFLKQDSKKREQKRPGR